MNRLQKFVADRLGTQAVGPHPDAEVLSAFAENALPRSEREMVAEHLSACSNCRDILFLAVPPPSEQQRVLVASKARPYFALRWGTLAACIVIGALLLVSRRQGVERMEHASSAKPQAGSSQMAEKLVAQNKPPADLDAMRKQPALKAPASATSPARGHAEPKPSVAEPDARMIFDNSDQVSVSQEAPLNAKPKPPGEKDLLLEGRNTRELGKLAGGVSAPVEEADGNGSAARAGLAASPPAPPASANQAVNFAPNDGVVSDAAALPRNAPALARADQFSLHGNVAGTISDSTGAAVANAKITAAGPLGEKTAVSDSEGKFSFSQLAAGTYVLKVDATGFRKALSQVAVLSDKPATADFKLQVGQASEMVEVEAQAAPVAQPSASNEIVALQTRAVNEVTRGQSTVEVAKKQKGESLHRTSAAAKPALPQQWSLSAQGRVQRSSDGGNTWVAMTFAEDSVFRAVASIGTRVWAAGNAAVLYRSVDNGQSWTQVIPVSNGEKLQDDITQIQFPDPQHVTLGTAAGQIWASSDGGKTWTRK